MGQEGTIREDPTLGDVAPAGNRPGRLDRRSCMEVRGVRHFLLVVAFALASGCGERGAGGAIGDAGREGGWEVLPEAPLSARHGAHAFSTGELVLVMGGTDTDPCPPNADCVPPERPALRDGAAFDAASGTWRRIAEAPVPLGNLTGAVLGDTLNLWVRGNEFTPGEVPAFLAYNVAEDRWEELPSPPTPEADLLRLVATDAAIVAYLGTQERRVVPDLLYDPASRTWRELPQDPLAASFDRAMVWTGHELILLAPEDVPQPGSKGPALYRAAAFDPSSRTWRRLPDSEVTAYDPSWFWAGGAVVNATLGTSDGGEVNAWGRSYPHGGVFDLVAERWSPLPHPPSQPAPYSRLSLGGVDAVVSLQGWVLYVPTGKWAPLPRPEGAAHEGEAGVWAGDRVFVWGGARWDGDEATLLDDGWIWTPPWSDTGA